LTTGVWRQNDTKMNQQINAKNFNINNYYYYYKDSEKIKLIDKNLLGKQQIRNAKPVTPVILDNYFEKQGVDTSAEDYKTIKQNYFKKHPEIPIINVDNEQVTNNSGIHKITKITTKPAQSIRKKKIAVPENTSHINIVNAGNKDTDMTAVFETALSGKVYTVTGKSQYAYRKSRDSKRIICDAVLQFDITTGGHKQTQKLTTHGTGPSKETAKQNALMKMQLLIKDIKPRL